MFFSLESLESLPIIKKLPFSSLEKRILGLVILVSTSVVIFSITTILILQLSSPKNLNTENTASSGKKSTVENETKVLVEKEYDPLEQEALLMAAEAYLKSGNTEKAGDFLERISTIKNQSFRQRRITAELLVAQNRLSEAQQHLVELRKEQPRNLHIASLYVQTVAPQTLLTTPLDSIVPGFSKESEILYAAGLTTKSTSPKDAALFLIEALNNSPQMHNALFLLGSLYREEIQLKDLHKSIQMLLRAVDSAPDSAAYWSALGLAQLEQFETADTPLPETFNKAEIAFKKAIKLQPNSTNHLYNLAELYSLENNYHFLSEELYTKAIKQSPSFWMASFKLGVLYSKNKKYNGASEQFWNALKYSQNNIRILHQLAVSLENSGNTTESQSIYNQIVTLDPKDQIALYKLQLMK